MRSKRWLEHEIISKKSEYKLVVDELRQLENELEQVIKDKPEIFSQSFPPPQLGNDVGQ